MLHISKEVTDTSSITNIPLLLKFLPFNKLNTNMEQTQELNEVNKHKPSLTCV